MKRIINNYYTCKSLKRSGLLLLTAGAVYMLLFFIAWLWLDDIPQPTMVEIFLIIPLLIYLMVILLLEAVMAAALLVGVPVFIGGIVCLVLIIPSRKRMKELESIRKANYGKMPGEVLWEMLNNGELKNDEYRRELANNRRIVFEQRAAAERMRQRSSGYDDKYWR